MNYRITATDKNGATATADFAVNITPNTAPVTGTLVNQVYEFGTVNTYTIPVSTDAEGDAIVYTGSACTPAGQITYNAGTAGSFATTTTSVAQTYTCTVNANDNFA